MEIEISEINCKCNNRLYMKDAVPMTETEYNQLKNPKTKTVKVKGKDTEEVIQLTAGTDHKVKAVKQERTPEGKDSKPEKEKPDKSK